LFSDPAPLCFQRFSQAICGIEWGDLGTDGGVIVSVIVSRSWNRNSAESWIGSSWASSTLTRVSILRESLSSGLSPTLRIRWTTQFPMPYAEAVWSLGLM